MEHNLVNLTSSVHRLDWIRASLYGSSGKMIFNERIWMSSSSHMWPVCLTLVNQAGQAYSRALLITLVEYCTSFRCSFLDLCCCVNKWMRRLALEQIESTWRCHFKSSEIIIRSNLEDFTLSISVPFMFKGGMGGGFFQKVMVVEYWTSFRCSFLDLCSCVNKWMRRLALEQIESTWRCILHFGFCRVIYGLCNCWVINEFVKQQTIGNQIINHYHI